MTPEEHFNSLPKVVVGFPYHGLVQPMFTLSFASAANVCRLPMALVGGHSSMGPAAARNDIISAVENIENTTPLGKIDFVLMMDTDMIFPPETFTRLISHNKDIVGAGYCRRKPPNEFMPPLPKSINPTPEGLIEVPRIPTGVICIRREIFTKLKKPYFRSPIDEQKGVILGEDYDFCDRARALSYTVWLDLALSQDVIHIGDHFVSLPPNSFAPQTSVGEAPKQMVLRPPKADSIIGARPNGRG